MKLPLEGRWLGLAALLALVFGGALLVAVRFVKLPTPTPPPPAAKPVTVRTPGIGIASGPMAGALLTEQSLLDPDPLFLPTEFNASQPRLPSIIRREPGTSFQPVLSKYTYTLAEARIAFPETVAIPREPVEALTFGGIQNPYEVLGRFAREQHPLPARQALIEVVQTKTGRVILSVPVIVGGVPGQLAAADWRPSEWLAAVDSTGLIGLPVLSRGSGVEAIDTFFRSYLAKEFHLGERLPPGFYSLRVGP